MRLDDKVTLKKLREAIDRALLIGNVAEDFGLDTIKAGRISYDRGGTSAKITLVAETTVNGKTKDEVAFDTYHTLFGLKPEHLGATFDDRGSQFKVTGIAPSRSRFPILAKDTNGRQFCFPVTIMPRLKVKEAA
jgi:hypothetical protein